VQRAAALNLFIDDCYHGQKFIKDGLMPASIIATSKNFRPNVCGIKPPLGTWAHVCEEKANEKSAATVAPLTSFRITAIPLEWR